MKAAVLRGKLKLAVEEVPVPEVYAGELLVKVKAASICGTDVRMYKNGKEGVDEEHPLTLGHEFAGVIEKVGPGVEAYHVGQRVSAAPNFGCGTCDLCVSGQTNACPDYRAFGVSVPGALAEYVLIPAEAVAQGNVMVLADDADFAQAALVEPLSCVYNGQTRMAARPGSDVLIIGTGPIGVMHAKMALLMGAAHVFVNDLNQERVKEACALVPEAIALASDADVAEQIRAYTGAGVDACIIAAPAPTAQTQSLAYMNVNGRLLFFGGLPKDRENVPLNTNLLHYRQLAIFGCTGQSLTDYRTCAKLVGSGRADLSGIISDRTPIDGFVGALEKAARGEGLKHVITFA